MIYDGYDDEMLPEENNLLCDVCRSRPFSTLLFVTHRRILFLGEQAYHVTSDGLVIQRKSGMGNWEPWQPLMSGSGKFEPQCCDGHKFIGHRNLKTPSGIFRDFSVRLRAALVGHVKQRA